MLQILFINFFIDSLDVEKLQRQQFAMRSFTESIEISAPTLSPLDETNNFNIERRCSSSNSQMSDDNNELRGFYDSNKHNNLINDYDNVECNMKASSTIDTIIEVVFFLKLMFLF